MLIPNLAAMVSKAMEVALQALFAAQSALAGVNALQSASEYQPGDSITVRTCSPGWLTSTRTRIYFDIPLNKPVNSKVTGVQLNGGTITSRGVGGYLVGTSTGGENVNTLNITADVQTLNVRCYITKDGGFDGTNNTPVTSDVYGVTLTFN